MSSSSISLTFFTSQLAKYRVNCVSSNGRSSNGRSSNGRSSNGRSSNGRSSNGRKSTLAVPGEMSILSGSTCRYIIVTYQNLT